MKQRSSLPWMAFIFLAGGAMVWAGVARAQEKPAPTTAPVRVNVDPRADAQLRRMGKSLSSAKQFTFTSHDTVDQVMENGEKVQLSKTVAVSVRRPDALVADVTGDLENLRMVYNGTKLMLFDRKDNDYAMQDVPNNIDDMFDFLASNFNLTAPLSDLTFADPYTTLIERVRQGTYLGIHLVGDVKCHHLAFRQEGIDWQIWIEDSPQALPRKMVITYKEQPSHPQFVAFLDKWDLSPNLEDSAFEIASPNGAKREDLVPVDKKADQAADDSKSAPSKSPPAKPAEKP